MFTTLFKGSYCLGKEAVVGGPDSGGPQADLLLRRGACGRRSDIIFSPFIFLKSSINLSISAKVQNDNWTGRDSDFCPVYTEKESLESSHPHLSPCYTGLLFNSGLTEVAD